MNDDIKKAKIDRFVKDPTMMDAVYEILFNAFLKERPAQDVYVLAASRLSIDFLRQAWKEFDNYKKAGDDNTKVGTNIGL